MQYSIASLVSFNSNSAKSAASLNFCVEDNVDKTFFLIWSISKLLNNNKTNTKKILKLLNILVTIGVDTY